MPAWCYKCVQLAILASAAKKQIYYVVSHAKKVLKILEALIRSSGADELVGINAFA